jgi:hypothetical protein
MNKIAFERASAFAFLSSLRTQSQIGIRIWSMRFAFVSRSNSHLSRSNSHLSLSWCLSSFILWACLSRSLVGPSELGVRVGLLINCLRKSKDSRDKLEAILHNSFPNSFCSYLKPQVRHEDTRIGGWHTCPHLQKIWKSQSRSSASLGVCWERVSVSSACSSRGRVWMQLGPWPAASLELSDILNFKNIVRPYSFHRT